MMTHTTLSRRRFVTTALTAAGGLALGVGIGGPASAAVLNVRPWNDDTKRYPGEIDAWVVIEPDDTVIIRYGRAEMGQGSFTALPQILTEELECDWAFVKPEYASANRNLTDNKVYGSLATGGSRAVRETGEVVQQAWLTEQVPQCGYCQSGQIMATAAYLKANPNPTDADIDANLTNICRCGTYERLRRAVHRAAALMRA